MSAEKTLGSLPPSLLFKIFLRLPSKSIARCRCVSKLWESLLGSPNFTELFLTQSATRPRLLFMVRRNNGDWCLYSCPQPQISEKNPESSLSVTAEFHMSILTNFVFEMSPPISGLFYSRSSQILCNPSTRNFLRLPYFINVTGTHIFFGYDPIDKRFTLLAINQPRPFIRSTPSYQILKLGSGKLSWRNIECPNHHYPYRSNICINGILYYMACLVSNHKIACFDLNSEEFKFMDKPWRGELNLLVNFKSKLGGINTKWIMSGEKRFHLELSLWVLEDVEKQEWSKHVYYLPPMSKLWKKESEYRILGVTGKGDIVLALVYTTNPFYVYFFNLEENTLQKVEIKGLEGVYERCYFEGCVDYVEELRGLKWS